MAENFRSELSHATRVDDEHDWSVHTVDYGMFKKRLLYFAQRRRRVRNLLRDSADGRLSERVLFEIMGPKSYRPPPRPESPPPMDYGGAGYIPFVDDVSTDNSNDQFSSQYSSTKRLKKRKIARWISTAERNEVIIFLSWEMDKVTMFYQAQWQNLSQKLEAEGCTAELGREILELLAFCTINILTVRQSLIRYDAFLRTYGDTPMLSWYIKKMTKERNHTTYRKILFHQELNGLIDVYVQDTKESDASFLEQKRLFDRIQEESKHAELLASMGHVVLRDTFIQTLRDYFLLGLVEDRLDLTPNYLTLRGTSLTSEIHQISQWRRKQLSGETAEAEQPSCMGPSSSSAPKLSFQEYLAIFLNLLSGFLYCMNYYIVEPTSTRYANALGAPDQVSGLLIGMMPIAALISSVTYSVWTNHSFRFPMLFSGSMLVVGNIIYAIAYKFGIVYIALAGRFMTGLGCPKVIIRRFMADTTPVALRTGVNAGFGMAIAVGSALGPAMAILLDNFDVEFNLPLVGTTYLNGMTGPGYFMAILWTLFTLTTFFAFVEPDRNGLEEQRRLEAKLVTERRNSSMLDFEDPDKKGSTTRPSKREDDLNTILSGETQVYFATSMTTDLETKKPQTWIQKVKAFTKLITQPVRLCLLFLFCKTFTIEALVSATSSLTKNRYGWSVTEVGTLGCINGLLVIPLSILVGWLSLFYQDRVLMTALVSFGCFGMFLLIDISDLIGTPTVYYNVDSWLAVAPQRYVTGYFLAFCSIQSFEGVIGSALSKVIPTALASGTFNSGLLATMVDTLGRASGDVFIFLVGGINMRQLMNLLFIPAFSVLMGCLITIRRNYDVLAV